MGIERGETCFSASSQQHVDDVFVGLALPDDAARTELDPCFPADLKVMHAVSPGVSRADGGIVALARVDVVVDAVQPRLFQPHCLPGCQESERAADRDADIFVNRTDHAAQGIHLAVREGAAAQSHAEAVGLEPNGLSSLGEEDITGLERVVFDIGPRNT